MAEPDQQRDRELELSLGDLRDLVELDADATHPVEALQELDAAEKNFTRNFDNLFEKYAREAHRHGHFDVLRLQIPGTHHQYVARKSEWSREFEPYADQPLRIVLDDPKTGWHTKRHNVPASLEMLTEGTDLIGKLEPVHRRLPRLRLRKR